MEKHLHRFYVPRLSKVGDTVLLPKSSSHHVQVLRLKVGEKINLFDGRGHLAEGSIRSNQNGMVVCQILSIEHTCPSSPSIVLVLSLPKGSKLEGIVRTCSELGVHTIHLAISERSVPRPKSERNSARMERLKRVALESCAIAGQPFCPQIVEPTALLKIAEQAPTTAQKILFWECSTKNLNSAFSATNHLDVNKERQIWAIIGPEGGIAKTEVDALQTYGFHEVGLGPYVLRVETAVAVVVSLLLDRVGRLS